MSVNDFVFYINKIVIEVLVTFFFVFAGETYHENLENIAYLLAIGKHFYY